MIDALLLGLNLQTAHVHGGYERQTPGIYVVADNCATLGIYRNSVNRMSVVAGCTLGTTWSLTIGAVTGYGRLQPLAVPSVSLPLAGAWRARVEALPRPRGGSAALSLSLERWF